MRVFVLLSVAATAIAGCSRPMAPGAETPRPAAAPHAQDDAEHRASAQPESETASAQPESETLAPVPFPRRELAAAISAGDSRTYRMEEAGKTPYLRVTRFVAVDEDGAAMEVEVMDLEGEPTGERHAARASWEELEGHAHFPARATTVTATPLEVPAGSFDALLYEVRTEQAGLAAVTRLWFTEELPGPPIKLIQELDGEVVLRMELVHAGPGRRSQR